jgi:hypothetical protein
LKHATGTNQQWLKNDDCEDDDDNDDDDDKE